MATRQSMEDFLQKCEDAIRYAQDQFRESSLQEQYNNDNYTGALQELEDTYNELCHLAHSANAQQREQLHRMRLQIQQLQNTMILQ
ncbi:YtzC family protein [Neobacillus sp. PS3-34]|uniref:YtzC family protein n=1 Tax=Neobacillus sp. PS3-34 TaxID=3070678 RepID=UPI0027E03946|nr:YtzC family protein [Neobacillus sp. PS3-34]WML50644.1 YtzC family protein [Neobacillus sp. PS3-34]